MSNDAGKNEGVRIVAAFDDRAVSLTDALASESPGGKSRNEGVRVLATFDDRARLLPGEPASPELDHATNGHVAALISQIESALGTIQTALAELKQIQSKAG
jgi:hypothetical protein